MNERTEPMCRVLAAVVCIWAAAGCPWEWERPDDQHAGWRDDRSVALLDHRIGVDEHEIESIREELTSRPPPRPTDIHSLIGTTPALRVSS